MGSGVETIGSGGNAMTTDEINVLCLVKGDERYIFLFNDRHRSDTLRTLGRFASDPDLSFSWYDAAVLSSKVRAVETGVNRCNF